MNWRPPPELPLLGPFSCTWTREADGLPPRDDSGCVHCGAQPDDEIHSPTQAVRVVAHFAMEGLKLIREGRIFTFNVAKRAWDWESLGGCAQWNNKGLFLLVESIPRRPPPPMVIRFTNRAGDAQGPMGERP